MRYSTLYKIPIRIVTIFLLLSSLHPGNYLHGQEQPDTLSFYLPNILVTAIESKTPGTVSLLPASTLEHTQPITIADLTQLLPGGLTNNSGVTDAQYFSVREVSLKNGVNQFHKNAAMGAQIWVDGSPLHFNTGINEPYEGYDARFLSLNQVKEAEIIRGIPSARYGNLTNSVLLLKTHQGKIPLSASIRYNPKLKQYMLGKGFCISPRGHTLNLLYQPKRFPYRRHTLGKPLPLVAHREKTRIKPYLHLSHRKGKAIRQRAESYAKTTIGSAIFHTRGMATRPTLAQEAVSENRRFPSKKQTNKESGQQCL